MATMGNLDALMQSATAQLTPSSAMAEPEAAAAAVEPEPGPEPEPEPETVVESEPMEPLQKLAWEAARRGSRPVDRPFDPPQVCDATMWIHSRHHFFDAFGR